MIGKCQSKVVTQSRCTTLGQSRMVTQSAVSGATRDPLAGGQTGVTKHPPRGGAKDTSLGQNQS